MEEEKNAGIILLWKLVWNMATQKTERDGKTFSWILGMYRVVQK
jgi:hypothetical protein